MRKGKLPYGYSKKKGTPGGVNWYEARVVRIIFALRKSQMSLGKISDYLNSAGYRPPMGAAWYKTSVHIILKNDMVYHGHYDLPAILEYGAEYEVPAICDSDSQTD